jgi:hypothetical protein
MAFFPVGRARHRSRLTASGRCSASVAATAAAVVAVLIVLLLAGTASAGRNDLELLNLCPRHPAPAGVLGGSVQECSWINRDASNGHIAGVGVGADAQSQFRSLMSELGVVIAPRLQTPADTLGFAGFQFSGELGLTKISSGRDFWNGVSGVNPLSPTATRPDGYLATVGAFARKGLWLPLPAFEFGGGFVNVVGSNLFALQAYAKLALQEGFHGWALPSVAVRAAASQLMGTDQVDMTVTSFDVLVSKAFSIAGSARFEPFLGWNMLFIDARSGVIDATPACDAYALHAAPPGGAVPSPTCAPMQAGTWDDLNANFTFPRQDVITRQRFFGGLKLKLAVLFIAAQYDLVPAGGSRDTKQPNGARDASEKQQTFSLSAGLDF